MDVDYLNLGAQQCKIGCQEKVIYHFLELSDGYHLFYPVNLPSRTEEEKNTIEREDPTHGPHYIGSLGHGPEIFDIGNLPTKSTIHVCHLDAVADQIDHVSAGIAADELEVISEGEGDYPTPNEYIERLYTMTKNSVGKESEMDSQETGFVPVSDDKKFTSYFGVFKSTLNLHPALWLHDGPFHPPPDSEFEDWETLPLFQFMFQCIFLARWHDVFQLWNLQDLVMKRINEVHPDLISAENKKKWEDTQKNIMTKSMEMQLGINNESEQSFYTEQIRKLDEVITPDLSKQNKISGSVESKIEQVLFRLRNYIRNENPDWGKNRVYVKKFETAVNNREHAMKNNPLFKEREDELDWLEFGDLLYISDMYNRYEPLNTKINSIKQYRNSGDKAHPFQTNIKEPVVENYISYLCDECLKDFDKLENQ